MEIKGVSIQSEENYYKILSVIKNKDNVTVKEVRALNGFLSGDKSKKDSKNIFSENKTVKYESKGFSAIRGLVHMETYSFFKME